MTYLTNRDNKNSKINKIKTDTDNNINKKMMKENTNERFVY